MLVEQVVTELRQQLADVAAEVHAPVYALSSWLIDVQVHGFHVTIEYAPSLGLFGVSTQGGIDGSEEIYKDTVEVAERVRTLCSRRQLCSPGKISAAAYAWSKQEAERLRSGDPIWAEHTAIVKAFERRQVVS